MAYRGTFVSDGPWRNFAVKASHRKTTGKRRWYLVDEQSTLHHGLSNLSLAQSNIHAHITYLDVFDRAGRVSDMVLYVLNRCNSSRPISFLSVCPPLDVQHLATPYRPNAYAYALPKSCSLI